MVMKLNCPNKRPTGVVCPVLPEEGLDTMPIVDLSAGYIQRALDSLPKQGKEMPWRLHMNYLLDSWALRGAKREGLKFESKRKHSPEGAVASVASR